MKFPYLLNDDTLTVFVNGEPFQVHREHAQFGSVKLALNNPNTSISEMTELLSVVSVLQKSLKGKAVIENDTLKWDGHVVHSTLGQRVLDIVREGFDVDPWLKFVENVYANPNVNARTELYDFLEAHDLPITEDGHFLAYKKVASNYRDVYSGTFVNTQGSVHEMPREQVDHNRRQLCSSGFHFCSREYLKHFSGTHLMILKINPADVVSIPTDYNFAKGRCWRYEVVGEISESDVDSFSWSSVLYDYIESDYEDNDYEDEDDEEDTLVDSATETLSDVPFEDLSPQQKSQSIWKKLRSKMR